MNGLNNNGGAIKTMVLKKLKALNEVERIELLNKYSKQASEVFHNLSPQDYMDVTIDIFLLQSSKNALVETYMNGDPIVDCPGCRLEDFLNREMTA